MTKISLPSSSLIASFSAKGIAVYAVRAAERVMATYLSGEGQGRSAVPIAENRVIQSVVAIKKLIALFPVVQAEPLEEVRRASRDLFHLKCEILRCLDGDISGEEGFELAAAGAAVSSAKSAADVGLAIAELLTQPDTQDLEVSGSVLAYEASSYSLEAANYADPNSVDPLIQQFNRDAGILQKGRQERVDLTFDDLPPLWITYTPSWLK